MKGLHHIHLRKRKIARFEPYPARSASLRLLDRVVLVVGVIGPLTTLPQILKLYLLQNATGISFLSWGLPGLLDIPWILYGIVHRERPITVAYSLWFVANMLVATGVLMFGGGF
jgi:uncharacterized protein with PQ loop repeat